MKTKQYARLLSLLLIFSAGLFTSCSKEIAADPIAIAKATITGAANNPTIWRLTEVTVNGSAESNFSTISSNGSNTYMITFYQGGSFKDSDGVVGKWDVPNPQALSTSYVNLISGVEVLQSYLIEESNSNILKLKYTYQGKVIQLTYVTTGK
ncbi:hypothetical protein [Sediminibacterium sp. TEGAF015]|uniref:hypothetical protein n=1 Tax=Sediminibacterium sp. TEGAF015 TaxID=575378 RepID=UPI0021FA5391|nr:hypothetical protein [Sediminibacterium sp. TEGAF015]BDQ11670.1 hypothetical protein TEGAF0_08870 [Sediminibacterium sp. TEGAF015]